MNIVCHPRRGRPYGFQQALKSGLRLCVKDLRLVAERFGSPEDLSCGLVSYPASPGGGSASVCRLGTVGIDNNIPL
ncbi:uncharacterized protein ColSpa_12676 [Colletotrichum spaethianum]|uniref:Uncharacterized protein n=1 Tax=Colletotrichum spaethianum TaxID=700344 RepID=A0AA37PG76_9PEZI|nr:uncharacterized protein ColSpa_03835 [Colletotrichum spaethianum]XP_049134075.1 uncharacterized protein ColSpa_11906 [Colletotrichum spaethianum]XP_049134845.1 uncharacterized protein ColSpa_12676 [Colletotrichum spaethianum]GKT43654.1 hypothetical protein ColSpa_03835 [Colletotrichum spaethianum]GKT51725.1 hypothetical protein ColSpa_11906 [Colletotrichum spaethianum]GKT52495.1 hypothetical protein ColSpa_12676 [Colletotrichum spaethianum]